MRFRLRAPATVVFTVLGPSPSCGIAGKKVIRGRRGMNRVRLNGRFSGHALAPGTYELVLVARRGKAHTRVGRISIQVVPPGGRVRRPGSAPVFSCYAATQSGIPGAGLFVASAGTLGSGSTGARQADRSQTTGRSGVLAEPPFHIGTGSKGWDTALALILYATIGLGSAVVLAHGVRFFRENRRL